MVCLPATNSASSHERYLTLLLHEHDRTRACVRIISIRPNFFFFVGCSVRNKKIMEYSRVRRFHSAQRLSYITLASAGAKHGAGRNQNVHTPNHGLSVARLGPNSHNLFILHICGLSPGCTACTESRVLRSYFNGSCLYMSRT